MESPKYIMRCRCEDLWSDQIKNEIDAAIITNLLAPFT